MGQSGLKPLFRLFTGQFVGLILTILLIISISLVFFAHFYFKLQNLEQNQLPTLVQQKKLNQLSQQINTDFISLHRVSDAEFISNQYQQLLTNIDLVKAELPSKKSQLATVLTDGDKLLEPLKRLSLNNKRNIQLKQNSIIQIQLISELLVEMIAKAEQSQGALYQQIMNDNVNDRVTASRARAHAKILQEVNLLRQLQSLLKSVASDLIEIDIHSSTADFELLADKVDRVFSVYVSVTVFDIQHQGFSTQMKVLEDLMLNEQRMIAKWRGHLRLAEQFFTGLTAVEESYNKVNGQIVTVAGNIQPTKIETLINQFFASLGLTDSPHVPTVFVLALTLLLLISVIFVFTIRLLLSKFQQSTQTLCTQLQNGEFNSASLIAKEQAQLVEIIDKLQVPEHGEKEFQAAIKVSEQRASQLAELAQIACWELTSDSELLKDPYINSIIGSSDEASSWRRWFERESIEKILDAAKRVKQGNQSESIVVTTITERPVQLVIDYNDCWLGTVADYETVTSLNKVIDKLHQELLENQQSQYRLQLQNNDQLNRKLISLLLQSQRFSFEDKGYIGIQRQLANLYDWCRQGKVVNQLQIPQKTLKLTDTNLVSEVYAVGNSCQLQTYQKRNTIYVTFEKQIQNQIKIDVLLFEFLLQSMIKQLLTEQFKAQLFIHLKMVDKKSGQQVVQFNFELLATSPFAEIPHQLSQLINDEYLPSSSYSSVKAIKDILAHMHGEQLELQHDEQLLKLQFNLPLSLSQTKTSEIGTSNLKHKNFLILAEKGMLQTKISDRLATTEADFEFLANTDIFTKQLSVKHLNRKAVDAVVIAPEYNGIYDSVAKHVASLPVSLQPKLLVMQNNSVNQIVKTGVSKMIGSPSGIQELPSALSELLSLEINTNIALSNDLFAGHHFESSSVELLFACQQPEQHQVLLKVLTWLGVHAKVVADKQLAKYHWQSGRYLMLITEFSSTPFVNFLVGNSVKRAVFTFTEQQLTSFKSEPQHEQWEKAVLPDINNVVALIELFKPWLNTTLTQPRKTPTRRVKRKLVEQKLSNEDKQFSQVLGVDVESENFEEEIFDLEIFARNQGSAEIAAIMLEEYIDTNKQAFESFNQAWIDKDIDEVQVAVTQLKNTATIMAAQGVVDTCDLIEQLIEQDVAKLSEQIPLLATELELVERFAEAI